MRVAQKAAITAAVKARVRPGVHAEVAVATGLASIRREHEGGPAAAPCTAVLTQIRPAFQLLGTENETVWNAFCTHLRRACDINKEHRSHA